MAAGSRPSHPCAGLPALQCPPCCGSVCWPPISPGKASLRSLTCDRAWAQEESSEPSSLVRLWTAAVPPALGMVPRVSVGPLGAAVFQLCSAGWTGPCQPVSGLSGLLH